MRKYGIYLVLFTYFLIGLFTIFFFNGTGDHGDSVHHYLYARYAPQHPELYFDHWAKPLFVLFASPFVQFGFGGMKLFNLLISLITIFFTYKTAKLFKYPAPLVSAILIICAPLNYLLTFSGLTEPLFALFLVLGLYFTQKKQNITGAAILSFLPFIRSEGLIFLGVFGFFYLLNKDWKAILFLALGHVVYSLAGFLVYHDLLWIFTKIPYATLKSTYGNGKLDHFITQLNFVLGIPIYVLLWIGLLSYLIEFVTGKLKLFSSENLLIVGGFLAFFVAHTLFWYLGIFNSAGLKRVFIGTMPLTALIGLKGFNMLTNLPFRNPKINLALTSVFVLAILVFPFLKNRAAIDWQEMYLGKDQELALEISSFLNQNPSVSEQVYYYTHPYLSEAFHRDHFDKTQRRDLTEENLKNLKPGSLVIWENWFAVVENGITEEKLDRDPRLQKVKTFSKTDKKGESKFSIYYVN